MPHKPFTHLGLTFDVDHYYLKRPRIVQKIVFNHRTFYAKFERIERMPDPLLSQHHLSGDYTVALPLVHHGRIAYVVFEYKGEQAQRFIALMRQLLTAKHYKSYALFYGKTHEKVQVFVPVDANSLSESDAIIRTLGEVIDTHFGREWKALPSARLPEEYNIVTLPYEIIEITGLASHGASR